MEKDAGLAGSGLRVDSGLGGTYGGTEGANGTECVSDVCLNRSCRIGLRLVVAEEKPQCVVACALAVEDLTRHQVGENERLDLLRRRSSRRITFASGKADQEK